MIQLSLRMVVRPDKRDELLKSLKSMPGPTSVERGCMSCRLYQDVEDDYAFALLEEWDTQMDLDAHIRKDTFRVLLEVMDLLAEPPEIKFNKVSRTAGMEVIESAFAKYTDGSGHGTRPALK